MHGFISTHTGFISTRTGFNMKFNLLQVNNYKHKEAGVEKYTYGTAPLLTFCNAICTSLKITSLNSQKNTEGAILTLQGGKAKPLT